MSERARLKPQAFANAFQGEFARAIKPAEREPDDAGQRADDVAATASTQCGAPARLRIAFQLSLPLQQRYLRLRPSWRSRLAVRPIETFGTLRINFGATLSVVRVFETEGGVI